MKNLETFDEFVTEKYSQSVDENINFIIDDIFFMWDDFIDDERKGIEHSIGGPVKKHVFDFNTKDSHFDKFIDAVKNYLDKNKIKYEFPDDSTLFIYEKK